MMNDLTPLTRPLQSQVAIDSVAKECPSEGFNYPTFRQLNKKARVYLSTPLNPQISTSYHLFSVANSRGWFVAVKSAPSGSELVLSTLDDLRSAFASVKDDDESLFIPKRAQSIPTKANIVKFACGDTRLLVGLEDGSVIVYDTSSLFTLGANDIQPLKRMQIQSTPLRQILPNPGTEPSLSGIFAVVGDGKVQLLNAQLEPQGGWAATDLMTQPIAADWSPKGKHIAIGLQTGDILTFSPTNKSTPNKHIPPTVNSILVSLNWLGPSHTFRTSYAAQGDSPATQHIITLDAKSSTATYVAPDHPFPSPDRTNQAAYVLSLSKWDADPGSNEDNKSLTVVGDVSSVDLEVLGNVGSQWYRQSQENPLSLPLDKSMDDTILLSLEVDMTDTNSAAPIMYAFLNDGSLQGWNVEHTKPYLGMIAAPSTLTSTASNSQMPIESQHSGKDADMGTSTAEPTPSVSAFGQSSFGQQSQSQFGGQQATAFGQTGFGQQPPSAAPTFGQSSFGQPSAFGSLSGGFGQANQSNTPTSAFNSVQLATGFSAFSGSTSAFGSGGAFGSSSSSNAFSGLNSSNNTNAFGSGNFGSIISNNVADGSASPTHSPTMTREASMSDSTPGFGGLSLGSATPSDPNAVNSMFGTFSATSTTTQNETTSAFGGPLLKPASGFGAFGNFKPATSFEPTKPPTTTSAFDSTSQPSTATTSGFGQSGFASPAFGKSSFGQPSFGKPSLGAATPAAPVSGGFGAFAAAPVTLGSAAQQQKTSAFGPGDTKATSLPSSGGFSAFASTGPATLGTALGSAPAVAPATGGGLDSFAPASPSTFGNTSNESSSKPFSAFAPAASAFGPTSGVTVDASKPMAFGGFADTKPLPFGTQPNAEPKPRTSVFGTSTIAPSTTSVLGNTSNSNIRGGDMDSPPPSPPSSPEPNSKAVSPFGHSVNPPPALAPISSGAFSNIQVTPNAFKPASGFGAFGSTFEAPKSSPFFKSPEATPPVVSAFAPVAQSLKPSTPVAKNAFGSPSVLGQGKSAFTPPTPQTTMATPTTGGFGAFGGANTGFSAFAGQKTSFSDLLKSGGNDTKDPTKPALAFTKDEDEEGKDKTRTSVFGTSVTTPQKEEEISPASQATNRQKTEELEVKDETPASEPEGKNLKNTSTSTVSDEASFANISASSATSSFVEVSGDHERSETLEGGEHSDEDAEHSGDDRDSFLSDNFSESSYKDGDSANEDSDEEYLPDDRGSPSPEPSAERIPRPRSPSATPQPEPPRIEVSTPPDVDDDKPSPSKPLPAREPSTTPPGTPEKESKPLLGANPSPGAAPGPSSFGVGLGRPSTRPARSSPLANAVLQAVEEEERTKSPPKPAKPPVSPKPVFGALPEQQAVAEDQPSINKRPKTPPLLSTMAPPTPVPSTPVLAPAIPPATKAPSAVAETTSKPGALPFSFGTHPAAASTPNLFGKAPLSNAGPSPLTLSRPDLARATTAPAAPGSGLTSLFGTAPLSSATPAFSVPPFSLSNAATTSPFATGGSSIFGAGKPPSLAPTAPGLGAKVTPPPPASGLFGTKLTTPQTHGPFGAPPSGPTQQSSLPFSFGPAPSTPRAPPTPVQTPPTPTPEAILEEGMQKECVYLVTMMDQELKDLGRLAKEAAANRNETGLSYGGSRYKADLGVPSKWSLGDLTQFKQVLMQYEVDLEELTTYREQERQILRELQSNMLKAGTRKEEIARFNKAKHDKEFAKMLKARTLGPELSETQTHLRKTIRVIRDRVQKLETSLQENKKKLAQAATLKPTFRAPSLDTINRTYRNIEITIDQQSDEVARLASRIAKLKVKGRGGSPAPRDARLPDVVHRRPITVTPNVAVTTAAALNAERSAQRLKKALLAVRKEPLLNTNAASAPPPPAAFKTPQKPSSMGAFAFQTQMTGPLFSEPVTPTNSMPLLDWNHLPEDNFNPTGSSIPQGRRGATGQRKHSSVPLKRNIGAVPPVTPPPTDFEWGPMPAFTTPPPAKGLPTPFISLVKK